MTNTYDNDLSSISAGAADWDSDLNRNTQILERGYHITQRAGQVVSSGQVLTLNSGGFFFPYAPGSADIQPHAYAFTAANSGDTLQALAWGIVRSLDINSPAVPGRLAFSTASGFLSVATLGLPVGIFTSDNGILFNPDKAAGGTGYIPSHRVQSVAISAVTNSTHLFTMSLGAAIFGWNRNVRVNGTSLSNVEIKFFADAARTDLQYQTASGGISTVTSFRDRAGWPIDTNSGTIYGSCQVFSTDVDSGDIWVIADWEV